jgi:hypothetical protein
MLPSACSFIVEVSLSCIYLSLFFTTCFGLHGHLQVCVICFYFHIPEGICFAGFTCTWLRFARFHLCFSVLFSSLNLLLLACLFLSACLFLLFVCFIMNSYKNSGHTPTLNVMHRNGAVTRLRLRISLNEKLRQINRQIFKPLDWPSKETTTNENRIKLMRNGAVASFRSHV